MLPLPVGLVVPLSEAHGQAAGAVGQRQTVVLLIVVVAVTVDVFVRVVVAPKPDDAKIATPITNAATTTAIASLV